MNTLIIYDFDGTIADSLEPGVAIYNNIAKRRGFKQITEENISLLKDKKPKEVMDALGVRYYQIHRIVFSLRKQIKKSIPSLKVQPGVAELLYTMKNLGFQQAILTSNSEENVKEFLRLNNLDIFDFLYCGSSAFGKARHLRKVVRRRGLDKNQVIYVGDEVRDINAANKAKIKVVGVSWGFNTKTVLQESEPYTVIEKPEDMLSLFGIKIPKRQLELAYA